MRNNSRFQWRFFFRVYHVMTLIFICYAGLSQVEVDRKLKSFGYNEFTVKDDESIIHKYLGQFKVSEVFM